jgi:A/G-specific adenine glycosylase
LPSSASSVPESADTKVSSAGDGRANSHHTTAEANSPYASWVSEIMLQQTRVDTVVAYHTRWMARFPTVSALAAASEDDVNALWSGLGYYRRARLLHKGAKHVCEALGGVMPRTVEGLKQIPGIGPYTAGAIASIAFGVNTPVVDGNVIRVLSRMRALGGSPKSAGLVQACWEVAASLNDPDHPGDFNQALMELGATLCSPKAPRCDMCPVQAQCRAVAEARGGDALGGDRPATDGETNAGSASSLSSSSLAETAAVAAGIGVVGGDTLATTTPSHRHLNHRTRRHIVIDYAAADDVTEHAELCRRASAVTKYPFAKKKKRPRQETWAVSVIEHNGKFLLLKRRSTGLLAGQWEFPSVQIPRPAAAGSDLDKPYVPEEDSARRQAIQQLVSRLLCSDSGSSSSSGSGSSSSTTTTISSSSSDDPKLPHIAFRSLGIRAHVFSHIKHTMLVSHERVTSGETLPQVRWERAHRWATAAQLSGGSKDRDVAALSDKIALTTGMRKVFKMVEAGEAAGGKGKGKEGRRSSAPREKKRKKTVVTVESKKISSFFMKQPVTNGGNDDNYSHDIVMEEEEEEEVVEEAGEASTPATMVKGTGLFVGCFFYPVVPALTTFNYRVRDFTQGLGSTKGADAKQYFIGRYNERRRSMYTSALFAGAKSGSDTWSGGPASSYSASSLASSSSSAAKKQGGDARTQDQSAGLACNLCTFFNAPPIGRSCSMCGALLRANPKRQAGKAIITGAAAAAAAAAAASAASGSSLTNGTDDRDHHRRDIHIGVDVGGPVGTPVHAFAGGNIHSLGYNAATLDYGNVIVTEHVLNGKQVWALHGHLSAQSLYGKHPGDKVNHGECLGWFGAEHENGGWPPHVHFQLSLVEPETHDMPGVVSTVQHAQALCDYPDPRMVMGQQLFEGDGLFE